MITNEKQYRSTKLSIEKLAGAVTALEAPAGDFPEVFAKAQSSALRSQIDELEEEVQFYEDLRAGKISEFSAESLHDLPDILIQAREIENMKRRLNEIYVHHTGRSYEEIENALDRDNFMTAQTAKQFGLIDKVIEAREQAA